MNQTTTMPASQTVHPRLKQAISSLGLTPRQEEIVQLLGLGNSHAEVAAALNISDTTLRSHLRMIFARTQCTSVRQVMALLIRIVTDNDR